MTISRLPPPFLSVKLPIMEKPLSSELTPKRLGFPNEFPYEFESPTFSPGFTSPGDSTETEDESSDDEENFLAGLTRRLVPSTQRVNPPLNTFNTKSEEKRQVASTSPQSTLSRLGSFSNSGSLSPILSSPEAPATSLGRDNAWDVISAAAGEVARLKMESYEPRPNPDLYLRRQNAALHVDHSPQQQLLLEQMWLCSQSRIKSSEYHFPKRVGNQEVPFETLRNMRHNATSNASWLPQSAGTPLKRPSAGTGVFLPRRYPTATSSDSHKRTGPVNTPAMLQSKINAQNHYFEEVSTGGPRRSQLDFECMFARSTLAARQGSSIRSVVGCCPNQERRLPQDWMY